MEDVRKRLLVFNKMWEDGKISYSVKVSMAKLSTGKFVPKYAMVRKKPTNKNDKATTTTKLVFR